MTDRSDRLRHMAVDELKAIRARLDVLHKQLAPLDLPEPALIGEPPLTRAWVQSVLNLVAEEYGIASAELVGPSRQGIHVRPRFVCAWLLREAAGFSFERIGRMLARDHTTILYGHHRVQNWRAQDPLFRCASDNMLETARYARAHPMTAADHLAALPNTPELAGANA